MLDMCHLHKSQPKVAKAIERLIEERDAALGRVSELEAQQARHERELNVQQSSHSARVGRLIEERDDAYETIHMLRAACESKEGGA